METKEITRREILDSKGNPIVEVDVLLESSVMGHASVPSDVSTGENEILGSCDSDKRRYGGKGVLKAVEDVSTIIVPVLEGVSVLGQIGIDHAMLALDSTKAKSKLDANAVLGVSLVIAKVTANYPDILSYGYIGRTNIYVMPVSMMSIINGGLHSNAPIAFQEFTIRPVGVASFKEGLRMGARVSHTLKEILYDRGLGTTVGDEDGFAPSLEGMENALNSITATIKAADYEPGKGVMIGVDCTSSEFYKDGIYDYTKSEGKKGVKRTSDEQVDYLGKLTDKYPIGSTENGMSGNNQAGWRKLTDRIDNHYQLVGDDLFMINVELLSRGIKEGCDNSVLIKIDQIGSLTEILNATEMVHRHGYMTVTSHRSGGTEDATAAGIAVAINGGQIKTGSLSRSDRMAKYSQLFRIEKGLGDRIVYGYKRIN